MIRGVLKIRFRTLRFYICMIEASGLLTVLPSGNGFPPACISNIFRRESVLWPELRQELPHNMCRFRIYECDTCCLSV